MVENNVKKFTFLIISVLLISCSKKEQVSQAQNDNKLFTQLVEQVVVSEISQSKNNQDIGSLLSEISDALDSFVESVTPQDDLLAVIKNKKII